MNTGQREKGPIYRFQSGAVYEGEWFGSMRDGYGIQTWKGKMIHSNSKLDFLYCVVKQNNLLNLFLMQMEVDMKVTGCRIKQMVEGNSIM